MEKIFGRVLVKETNIGIPNLVVSAYDSDQEIEKEYRKNKNEHIIDETTIERLGKRIGSVLTNNDGYFIFNYKEVQFSGIETRPDLILVVFAPEDILSIDKPYPLPPHERILYISSSLRMDSGLAEAYIIRILKSQLDKFQIRTDEDQKTINENQSNAFRFFDSVERTRLFNDNFKEKIAPILKEKQEKNKRTQKNIQKVFKDFSAIPHSLRNHPRLLKDTGQLDNVMDNSIKESVERLNKFEGNFRFSLSESDIKALGLEVKEGACIGEIKFSDFLAKAVPKTGGVDLIRLKNACDLSLKDLEKKYLKEKPAVIKKKKPENKKGQGNGK